MELLLWLWFYDTRWLFNFKMSLTCYKNIWLIPLLLHSLVITICIYYLQLSSTFSCDKSIRMWLYTRTFFSALISATIVFFMIKINKVFEKEKKSFETPIKIMPYLENNMSQYDFWIKRKSLLSTSGILLLFLGLVSLFWSCMIISFYYYQDYYLSCEVKIQKLLNIHSIFIIVGNAPLALILAIMLIVKISCLIAAFLCPNILISFSKFFTKEKMEVQLIKYS